MAGGTAQLTEDDFEVGTKMIGDGSYAKVCQDGCQMSNVSTTTSSETTVSEDMVNFSNPAHINDSGDDVCA